MFGMLHPGDKAAKPGSLHRAWCPRGHDSQQQQQQQQQ
jgi:hypothetical protein